MALKSKKGLLFNLAVALLVLDAVMVLSMIDTVRGGIEQLSHHRNLEAAVADAARAFEVSETAFRNDLLGVGGNIGQVYPRSLDDLNASVSSMRTLFSDRVQIANVTFLQESLIDREELFREVTQTRNAKSAPEALAVLITSRGRHVAAVTRRLFKAMKDEELSSQQLEAVKMRKASESGKALVVIGTPFGLGMLALVMYHSRRQRSEAERAVADVRRDGDRLSATLSSLADALIVTDDQGTVQFLNPSAEVLTGWDLSEARGKPLEEVFSVLDETSREPIAEPTRRAAWSGNPSNLENHRLLVSRDGSERPIENSVAPIREDDGTVSGMVLCFRDVSKRSRALRELKASKKASDSASRAKDQFLAVLSHELRTPLTPILMAVSSFTSDEVPEGLRPTLEMIRRNVVLEARMIDDLLDLARIERDKLKLHLETVDAHELIARALEMCKGDAQEAGLEVRSELAAQSRYTQADPVRLMQVFWNLAGNAVKFAGRGRLTVRTRNEPSVPGSARDSGLVIEFEDDGVGIEPGFLPRLFTPFEQGLAPSRRPGLGLGLAISKQVIEAHGGRIDVESAGEGQGATFRVRLATVAPPAEALPGPKRRELDAPPGPPEASGLSVLLVEDNKDTLQYMATVLRRRGHSVREAATLAEAFRALDEGRFDVLVSDVELPDGTGLELMRRTPPDSRMLGIAVSGFGAEEDVRQSLAAGFTAHLTKPISVRELEAALSRTLETSAGVQEIRG